jgi:thiol-disulfide isomerase/thioredoxin
VLLALAAMLVGATVAQAQTVRLKWVEAGAAGRMSAVTPHAIDLSDQKPPQIRRIPANVTNPRFGALTIGPVESPAHVNVLLDTPPGKPPRLFVDANGDGDFTNDPAPQWAPQPYVGGNQRHYTEFVGGVTIPVQYGATKLPLHLTLHRFDPGDPAWSGLKGAILYAPDYAREGDLKLGANTYHVMLLDALIGGDFRGLPGGGATGIFLLIDVNGNGVFDTRGEMYSAGQPFNIGGTTYALKGLTASGETLELVKSPVKVAEIPPPPDLRLGKIAPAFIKKATDGSTIHFPSGYGGKLVLLSFWASDCGVCTTEMPEVVKAYQFFHDAGLDIVGVSLDPANVGAQVAAFTKHFGMPWPEIYDGKWLQADVAELYFVHLTPTAILVEGGTGKVLATGADLRGENLLKTIAAALKSRNKSATNR